MGGLKAIGKILAALAAAGALMGLVLWLLAPEHLRAAPGAVASAGSRFSVAELGPPPEMVGFYTALCLLLVASPVLTTGLFTRRGRPLAWAAALSSLLVLAVALLPGLPRVDAFESWSAVEVRLLEALALPLFLAAVPWIFRALLLRDAASNPARPN